MIDSGEEVVNRYRYSPFGEPLLKEEQVYNPYQYTGRRYDEESGLYYYRARMYSPEMSRFTSNDPAKQGENWYAYVGNDPVNNRDPSGKYMQPMWMFNPYPYIPYREYGIKQYAYYPKQALGGGYPGYESSGRNVFKSIFRSIGEFFIGPEEEDTIEDNYDWCSCVCHDYYCSDEKVHGYINNDCIIHCARCVCYGNENDCDIYYNEYGGPAKLEPTHGSTCEGLRR